MTAELERWGWDLGWAQAFERCAQGEEQPARLTSEHRGGWMARVLDGEVMTVMVGKLRRAIKAGSAPRPAVGDWVVVERSGTEQAAIHAVLPRRTKLSRKAAGMADTEQVVAANVDVALLVSSLGPDLNVRRLERYLALTREGGATPVIVLSKADLAEPASASESRARVDAVAGGAPIVTLSSLTGEGLEALSPWLAPKKTVVLLGSSGVGKSTLANRLLGELRQATGELREGGRGRHTTTRRELVPLPGGALIVDTPGMRELGLWNAAEGVDEAFPDVASIAETCRFRDCAHESEPGCAVRAAIVAGGLSPERANAYRKLRAERLGGVARKAVAQRTPGSRPPRRRRR